MMALRCTQKLLARLKAKPGLDSTVASTVLGQMNEMAFCLSVVRDRYVDVSLEKPTLYLADTIYRPIGYKSPIEMTQQLFGLPLR